jgi:uncharacterized membrane protein YbjE (DUF340 family)
MKTILCFGLGFLLGIIRLLPVSLDYATATIWLLYVLLLLVGISIGSNLKSLETIRKMGIKAIFVPIAVLIGTGLGAAIVSVFTKLSPFQAILVSSGLGYYSLSSVMITSSVGSYLGALALLTNILREIGALVLAPLLHKYFGKLAPITAAGATAMDTCLPVITQESGKEYVPLAFFSGFTLTMLVPFLVTFLIQFVK